MFISKFISLKNKIYKEKNVQKVCDDEEEEAYYCICCFEPYSNTKPKKNGSNVWNARLGLIKLAVVANFHMFVTIAYQNNNFNFIFFTYLFL